jgi:hypothetical protein
MDIRGSEVVCVAAGVEAHPSGASASREVAFAARARWRRSSSRSISQLHIL